MSVNVRNDPVSKSLQESSLNSLFQLFRGLGLRHVVVVDSDNKVIIFVWIFRFTAIFVKNIFKVVGIVTRKDIARFKSTRYKNRYAVRELYFSMRD